MGETKEQKKERMRLAYAVMRGRKGGLVKSEAKTKAVRLNALKGGRKPKIQLELKLTE